MDDRAFDRLTRLVSASETRRGAVRAVLGSLFGGALFGLHRDQEAGAESRKGKKRRGTTRRDGDGGKGKRRSKGAGKRRGSGKNRSRPSSSPEETQAGGEVTVEACLPPGQPCAKAGECCSLKCSPEKVCLCTENRQCPKPKSSCKQRVCSRGRCLVVNREAGSRCADDGNPCTRDLCDDAGQCTHPVKPNGTACPGGVCRRGRCCVPACATDKPCGPDGCGGSCGTCSGNDQCQSGTCVCVPDCADKECGDDGCGGQCQPGCSGSATVCTEGRCVGCVDANTCPDPGSCKTKNCVGGTCTPDRKPDGTSCQRQNGASGFCNNGECRECVTNIHCPPPQNGTATCAQGTCIERCDVSYHRLCGNVCQECCNDDDQCRSIHDNATCAGGQCRCPAGLTRCGFECIDISREPRHCGTCTRVCPSGVCIGGQCQSQEVCGLACTRPECEFIECPGNKECSARRCSCPSGMVDCDGDGDCEACGRCGVTGCPPNPQGGAPGFCCADGTCSCGGTCCPSGYDCFVTQQRDPEGTPIPGSEREVCRACVECWGVCCAGCINGNCVHHQPPSGGTIRRR